MVLDSQIPRRRSFRLLDVRCKKEGDSIFSLLDVSAVLTEQGAHCCWGYVIIQAFANGALRLCGAACGRVATHCDVLDFRQATRHTNNTGEITALVMVMEMFGLTGAQRCVFCSDSMYALDLAQSLSRAPTNTELVEVLRASAWHLKERQGCDTDFVDVRGHSGEPLNDFADALARFAGGSHVPLIVHPPRLCAELGSAGQAMFPQPAPVRRASHNAFPSLPSFSMSSINDGTLDSADARKPAHDGGTGLAVTGKCLFLQEHFVAAEFDLIGLQECRTPALQTRQMQHYFCVSSGASKGCCGCELLLRHTLGVSGKSISVFAHSPRLLAVAIRSNLVSADVIVTHAPCEESPDAPRHWQMLRRPHPAGRARQDVPLLMCVDANGTTGCETSSAVGPHSC